MKNPNLVSSYWKVHGRQVYCETFSGWLRETFWCHVVLHVFPRAHDFGSDALCPLYREDPTQMVEQLGFLAVE